MLEVISLGAGVQPTAVAPMAAHGEIEPMPDCAVPLTPAMRHAVCLPDGRATPTDGRAPTGTKPDHELTFKLEHAVGAGRRDLADITADLAKSSRDNGGSDRFRSCLVWRFDSRDIGA